MGLFVDKYTDITRDFSRVSLCLRNESHKPSVAYVVNRDVCALKIKAPIALRSGLSGYLDDFRGRNVGRLSLTAGEHCNDTGRQTSVHQFPSHHLFPV